MNKKTDKIITEFMGFIHNPKTELKHESWKGTLFGHSRIIFYENDFYAPKWSTSWDWIMPVVNKILNDEYLDLGYDTMKSEEALLVQGSLAKVDINITYKAVIEFIKYYNEKV